MKHYDIFTPETAPQSTAPILQALKNKIGFVPNVFSVMGGSPAVLGGFVALNQSFGETTLDATEREVVQIAASVVNEGSYCVAGHTSFARKQKVSDEVVAAVRSGGVISDPKLAALHRFSHRVAVTRGHLGDAEVAQFLSAGYTPTQVQEVILGVCVKMFSNITDNVLGFPLDEQFSDYAWEPESVAGAGFDEEVAA